MKLPTNPYCVTGFTRVFCFFLYLVPTSFKLCVTPVCCCCLTAKDKGEKKLFGYSFVPLMQEDGRTLPDGTHELIIHKVFDACTQDFD